MKTIQEVKNNIEQIGADKYLKETLKNAKKIQSQYNLFVNINESVQINDLKKDLSNIPYTVKDNIVTKDLITTASSKTLENYIPIFNATVIEKLNEQGALNIGKTTMDELGMGSYGLSASNGIVKNPLDAERVAGGSSAGSAVSVASSLVPFSLGSDTGDSIRKPASYCGIVGYKPTYGLVSRYGLIPFASSLDHIGVFTNTVYDAALVINSIKGLDDKDMTTFKSDNLNLLTNIKNENKNKKLFYLNNFIDIKNYQTPSEYLESTLSLFNNTIDKLIVSGYEVIGIDFDENLLKALKPVYDVISNAEATTNNSNLTGIIFGPRDKANDINEMIINYRTNNFGSDVKKRFVLGSFVLQKENQKKYFNNASKIRNLIVREIKKLFCEYDALIMPAAASIAPKIKDNKKIEDELEIALENNLVIGNFGGFPSITIPMGKIDNLPIGINITQEIMTDDKLLNLAYNIEQIIKGDE